jgi:hypothetical protein
MIRFFILQTFYVFLFFSHIQPLYAADHFCRIGVESLRISEKTLGVALVIGNSAYQSKRLRHPKSDAEDIGDLLESIGFSVAILEDIHDKDEFSKVIGKFVNCLKINKDLVAFFYFSGYGKYVEIQIGKMVNYLLPTGIDKIDKKSDILSHAYSVEQLFLELEDLKNIKVFILDACRKYPKFSTGDGLTGDGLTGDGLAEMNTQDYRIGNYLVAFPTIISKVNDDGIRLASQTIISDNLETKNSLYVEHLLNVLGEVKTKVKRIEDVFSEINEAMGEDERNKVKEVNVEWIKGAYFYPNPVSLEPIFCFGEKCPTGGVDPNTQDYPEPKIVDYPKPKRDRPIH